MLQNSKGYSLVEILVSIGVFAVILFAALSVFSVSQETSRIGYAKTKATQYSRDYVEKIKNIKRDNWDVLVNGRYEIIVSSGNLLLQSTVNGEIIDEYQRYLEIEDAYRDDAGVLVDNPGTLDPSTKRITVHVSWDGFRPGQLEESLYLTRYQDNLAWIQTTESEFNLGTLAGTQVVNNLGGEVEVSTNNKAKWCSPEFSASSIDLPDGPPVAVAAKAYSSIDTPNDIFSAVSPLDSTSVKLAHIQVPPNVDPPAPTLKGIFTLDPAQYSDVSYLPSGIDLTNNFKTNDVTYYQSSSGKVYALLATNLPQKEVIAVQVHDGVAESYQDPVNHIYKYWTFFNTRMHGTVADLETGLQNPSAHVADSGGDDNGYQSGPTEAYVNGSGEAIDSNSGSGNSTSCASSQKDRHQYYDHSFSIPADAAISGIEVRLDARVDNTSGSPHICAELSWDGGTTWTAVQTTGTLGTSQSTRTLGGSADTWGRTWTPDELSNTNFRLRLTNVASSTSRDFRLDWAAVNVYYSGLTNDQAPFGYGAKSVIVLEDRGYVASGGYLYVFDLSTIDSKSPSLELEQVGCRIEIDGYDCQPGSQLLRKYSTGETGTSWSSTAGQPFPYSCSDGGNIELYADNDLYGVNVGGNNYIYVAVGARTNPEMNIVNASTVPTSGTSPSITSSSCGRVSGGSSEWSRIGSLDFNNESATEEAANSIFVKSDGSRAYISSNGGIDANGDGDPDSKQFYVIDTSNKSAPSFLSGSSSGPSTGFYYGTDPDDDLFPRQSLTVLNGERAVLVGEDGYTGNTKNPKDYQVLDITNEAIPLYCGGLDFDDGFNDLTSVSEADGDNFVYMVANTNLNELKVVQGGPDGTYISNGTYDSQVLDIGYAATFNRFEVTDEAPGVTNIEYQVGAVDVGPSGTCADANFSNFSFVGPDGTFSSYFTEGGQIPLDNDGSGYENPAQCFKLRAYMETTNYEDTPSLFDFLVNYSP